MRTAAPLASVIFQMPETRNSRAKRIADNQASAIFHPGNSKRESAGNGCAILSFMVLILALVAAV